jgi:hypothetical protein
MMKLEDYKFIFVAVGLVGVLIFASPALSLVLRLPGGERFSELWVLGPGHMAEDYPFNVRENESYLVYVGVGNHMGSSTYYVVYVKFRNQTEPLPDALNGTPSVLDPLLEYRVFLRDNEVLEREVLFSFEGISFEGNFCRVSSLVVDGCVLNVDKSAVWDEENHGFCFQLFFELWVYNATVSDFQYHNRFVWIWLNMTVSI